MMMMIAINDDDLFYYGDAQEMRGCWKAVLDACLNGSLLKGVLHPWTLLALIFEDFVYFLKNKATQ